MHAIGEDTVHVIARVGRIRDEDVVRGLSTVGDHLEGVFECIVHIRKPQSEEVSLHRSSAEEGVPQQRLLRRLSEQLTEPCQHHLDIIKRFEGSFSVIFWGHRVKWLLLLFSITCTRHGDDGEMTVI